MSSGMISDVESSTPFIMAITGYAGAGKDKFATLLEQQFKKIDKDVVRVSSGDLIRQYVRDHDLGDPSDRTVLQKVATEKAAEGGANYWLEHALTSAVDADVMLYPGLRQVPEVKFVHNHGGVLVVVDVPIEQRYERSQLRARPGDEMSFEQFKELNDIERRGTGGVVQQIEPVTKQADVTIVNDGTLEQLEAVAAQIAADYPDTIKDTYKASEL